MSSAEMTIPENRRPAPRFALPWQDQDRQGLELLGVVVDMLDEAISICRRIGVLLAEVHAAEIPASHWEQIASVHGLLRALDCLAAETWFGAQRLSGATLEVGCPALTLTVPDLSATALGYDVGGIELEARGALSGALDCSADVLEQLLDARQRCEGIILRLRWRCG